MKKLNIEAIVLIIFCTAFLWFAAGNILDNKITHDFPVGFFASDSFQNYGIAEGIKESGNYKFQPMSVAGGYKDVVGTHYPTIYHLTALFSVQTGIKVYDSLIFMIIFLLLSTSLMMYFIIRKFSKGAAMIALPLMMLVSYSKFSSAITWGQHGAITGSFFLVALLWAFTKFELNNPFFIIIFLSGTFFGHQPEFVFGLGFIFLYFVLKFIRKDLKAGDIKKIITIGVITLLIISYYLIIFKFAWVSAGFSALEIVSVEKFLEGRAFPPVLLFDDFNFLILIFSFIGIAIVSLMLFKKKNTLSAAMLFLFLLGLTNYIGAGHKAFQQRFLWPIYLSAFFGIGIYYAIKFIMKRVNVIFSAGVFILLLIIFIPAFGGKTNAGSSIDAAHWAGFDWIRDNVEMDKPVYFLYQDMIGQRSIYYASTQRETYVLDVGSFIQDIQSGMIKRSYKMVLSAEGGAGLPYRKSLFEFGKHMSEVAERMKERVDICTMPYIVFDKVSSQEALSTYNLMIANELLKNEWISVVYGDNPSVVIIKNNRPGVDCIEERSFNE